MMDGWLIKEHPLFLVWLSTSNSIIWNPQWTFFPSESVGDGMAHIESSIGRQRSSFLLLNSSIYHFQSSHVPLFVSSQEIDLPLASLCGVLCCIMKSADWKSKFQGLSQCHRFVPKLRQIGHNHLSSQSEEVGSTTRSTLSFEPALELCFPDRPSLFCACRGRHWSHLWKSRPDPHVVRHVTVAIREGSKPCSQALTNKMPSQWCM